MPVAQALGLLWHWQADPVGEVDRRQGGDVGHGVAVAMDEVVAFEFPVHPQHGAGHRFTV
mgnify:CR=1 FL=1